MIAAFIHDIVMPEKAGIQSGIELLDTFPWTPAFAGVTNCAKRAEVGAGRLVVLPDVLVGLVEQLLIGVQLVLEQRAA